MEYCTIHETAEKWGISVRRLQVLCAQGRVEGAERLGRAWAIPLAAQKPTDARVKSGKYIKKRTEEMSKTGRRSSPQTR